MLAEVLRICYNGMWIFETRPVELNWHVIKVIPKSGKSKTVKENYRPIFLMSVFGKTFFFLKCHFGFMLPTGTEDCLLFTLDLIEQQQRAGVPAHVVLFDWKSAFDTVPHEQFTSMLEADFGMHGHALSYSVLFS